MFFVLLLALTLFPACSYWRSESETVSPVSYDVGELQSAVPFSTKEPEIFQSEIIVSTGGVDDVTFVARNESNRRYDYNYGAKKQLTVIKTAEGESFTLLPSKKVYAEIIAGNAPSASGNLIDSLTTEWLNVKPDSKFEALGTENNLVKYRAVFGDQGKSEAIIFVDEVLSLPVRQEFYTLEGEQKTLNYTFELKNFQLRAQNELFTVPPEFRKVTVEEFYRILHSED